MKYHANECFRSCMEGSSSRSFWRLLEQSGGQNLSSWGPDSVPLVLKTISAGLDYGAGVGVAVGKDTSAVVSNGKSVGDEVGVLVGTSVAVAVAIGAGVSVGSGGVSIGTGSVIIGGELPGSVGTPTGPPRLSSVKALIPPR